MLIENRNTTDTIIETIFCPNCGKEAHNFYILKDEIVRTSCRSCDYLMIKCARTGKVIEAYAPGIKDRVI